MPSITQICSKSSSLPMSVLHVHASPDGTQDPAMSGFYKRHWHVSYNGWLPAFLLPETVDIHAWDIR